MAGVAGSVTGAGAGAGVISSGHVDCRLFCLGAGAGIISGMSNISCYLALVFFPDLLDLNPKSLALIIVWCM